MVVPLARAKSLPNLRIMPLGDSITKGNGDPDGNGYRQKVRGKILDLGSAVDMIGSLQSGKMLDNDHEGHSGEYLAGIRDSIQLSIRAQPNVVLVHAGTNNMDKEVQLPIAHDLIEEIIDLLFQGSPDTAVLVAPVIWANDDRMNNNTEAFNKKLARIVEQKQNEEKHILSVPIDIGPDDLSDKKHPNVNGYVKMATAWFNAIVDANDRGWIGPPTKVDPAKLPGMGLGYNNTSPGGKPLRRVDSL
ncbi:SGNH hydrolase-type esterase domain-containing protein [Aspergillus avenaceus]|uniref:SGNH hydrolase-type esterase domain-containing protein n=1 Tax=Aspergillus avenaceus TaxID=36643 RepID=A0A5N6TRW5_ASPAV|nr:SGNH hydrolase-type esterase domain-containing protein [Aspergillus avenaceus]